MLAYHVQARRPVWLEQSEQVQGGNEARQVMVTRQGYHVKLCRPKQGLEL